MNYEAVIMNAKCIYPKRKVQRTIDEQEFTNTEILFGTITKWGGKPRNVAVIGYNNNGKNPVGDKNSWFTKGKDVRYVFDTGNGHRQATGDLVFNSAITIDENGVVIGEVPNNSFDYFVFK